jgi:hypothetical protein
MELRHNGQPCPEFIQRMMSRPGVLRARAAVRRSIAEQDRAWGDTLAEHRNLAEAQRLEGAAYEAERSIVR